MVEKCFECAHQMVQAAVSCQPLHQPELAGDRRKSQRPLEMGQAGLPKTLPGLHRVDVEAWMRQLNTQHYLKLMALQAQLVVLFKQLDVRLAAVQAVGKGLEPTARRC